MNPVQLAPAVDQSSAENRWTGNFNSNRYRLAGQVAKKPETRFADKPR